MIALTIGAVTAVAGMTAGFAVAGGDIWIPTAETHKIPDGTGKVTMTAASQGPGTITDMFVGVRIEHPQTRDLKLSLKGPDGTKVVMSNRDTKGPNLAEPGSGCGGNLTFFRAGNDDLSTGSAPYADTFAPVQSFDVYYGGPAEGDWKLIARDLKKGNRGKIRCFLISFYTQP
jgi:subtilisin-like proprotein convertase family protein